MHTYFSRLISIPLRFNYNLIIISLNFTCKIISIPLRFNYNPTPLKRGRADKHRCFQQYKDNKIH